jgi:dGTPase
MLIRRASATRVREPRWLSVKRLRPSKAKNGKRRTFLEQASSDRARVIFSSAFRRLHQKTQVFALESDGSVRTRMTHSLEVAHIGMYLVETIFRLIDGDPARSGVLAQWKAFTGEQRMAIRTFVEVACLVHDIGNPPFGHFGEKLISDWFERRKAQYLTHHNDNICEDFHSFDGNKQGFRILTRLQRNMDDGFSLNLSYAQLAATVKYPVQLATKKKGSIFESERELKETIWTELGLDAAERHPLVLLMEAADDIAYGVSDIEDGDTMALILDQDLAVLGSKKRDVLGSRRRRITKGRTDLTVQLVEKVAVMFLKRLRNARDGRVDTRTLLSDEYGILAGIKAVAKRRIYCSRVVLANEVTARSVINGLLDALEPMLRMKEDVCLRICDSVVRRKELPSTAQLTSEPGLLSLFPFDELETYLELCRKERDRELFHRAHLMVDFIAGMTDDGALKAYRKVSGQTTYAAPR